MNPQKPTDTTTKIIEEISKIVVGKTESKEILLIGLLSEGHVLIEGHAGTAKTLLAKTFAGAIGGEFKRIQFTPDMLPSDVTGFNVYSPDGRTRFVAGPLFGNIILADELNRTTPRTQAALIEAMQERQVTIEGATHPLKHPFMVVASQLPYGSEGTYPLTEVQADRFMFRIWSDYPSKEDEQKVIANVDYIEQPNINYATTPKQIIELQETVKKTHVSQQINNYIVTLIQTLRNDPDTIGGPSTRASIALFKGSRTYAFLQGRNYVIPDDVKKLAPYALTHRIRVKPEAEIDDITPKHIIQRTLTSVPVPKTT
ncbi:MAG: MoxR family ATPase [Candidatus Bathyarchaeia archaeon]